MLAVRDVLIAALLAGCGDGGGFPDAQPIDSPPLPGSFTLNWTLTDSSSAPLPCGQVGAQAVTVLTHNRAFGGGSTEVFVCSTLMGMSQPLVAGTYDMTYELDSASEVLAVAPEQKAVVIGVGQNVALTPLAFSVNATGGIKLNLMTPPAGGNCATVANGGAGITGMTLTLSHSSGGACEPVLFTIAPYMTFSGGTYQVDCTTPMVAPCIDSHQQLSVTGVKSDGYQLHIRGKGAAPMNADCWLNDDTLPVPPLGHDVTRTLTLGAAPLGTPGC